MICTSIIKEVPSWNHVLKDFFTNGLFSDVTLRVIENEKVFSLRCHRLVIASWGGVLDDLLSRETPDEDVQITLCDTSNLLLKQLVTFMYHGFSFFQTMDELENFKQLAGRLRLKSNFDIGKNSSDTLKDEHHRQPKESLNNQKKDTDGDRTNEMAKIITSSAGWKDNFLQDWTAEPNDNEAILTIDKSQIAYFFDSPSPTESTSTSSLFEDPAPNNIGLQSVEPSLTPTSFCSDDEDVGMKDLLALYSISPLDSTLETNSSCTTNLNRSQVRELDQVKAFTLTDSRCSYCHKVFQSQHYLKFHESSVHQKDKKSSCNLCNKVFTGDYYLKQHHRRMHSESRPHVCHLCQASFSVRYDLVVHLRTHDSVKPYACSSCGKTYTTQRALKEHERTHTGERPYQCSVCNRRFALPKTLRVHYRQHSGERPYLCPKCGATFVQNSTLRNHIKNNHGSEYLTPKTFSTIK